MIQLDEWSTRLRAHINRHLVLAIIIVFIFLMNLECSSLNVLFKKQTHKIKQPKDPSNPPKSLHLEF